MESYSQDVPVAVPHRRSSWAFVATCSDPITIFSWAGSSLVESYSQDVPVAVPHRRSSWAFVATCSDPRAGSSLLDSHSKDVALVDPQVSSWAFILLRSAFVATCFVPTSIKNLMEIS